MVRLEAGLVAVDAQEPAVEGEGQSRGYSRTVRVVVGVLDELKKEVCRLLVELLPNAVGKHRVSKPGKQVFCRQSQQCSQLEEFLELAL
jgi:hypothetical protein